MGPLLSVSWVRDGWEGEQGQLEDAGAGGMAAWAGGVLSALLSPMWPPSVTMVHRLSEPLHFIFPVCPPHNVRGSN